jgi:hypothetical protein
MRDSIEFNICNMLEKILLDDDESTAFGTEVDNNPSEFVRKEKKLFSNIDKNRMDLHGDLTNFENLYEKQRFKIYKHKKFNTTNQNQSPIKGVNEGLIPPKLFTFNDIEVFENFVNEKLDHISEDTYLTLRGNICTLLKNQNSSRILQNCLKKTDPIIIRKLFFEIIPELDSLILNPYGNYFCQKFYSHIQFEEKLIFLNKIRSNIVTIANNAIGTYPLQTIIEKLKTQEEIYIISESFRNKSVLEQVCNDIHGVHVIEKILICFPEEFIFFLFEYILGNFIELCNNPTGLILVKKVIMQAKHPLLIQRVQYLIVNNFNTLIQNAYGNYTIQIALEVIYINQVLGV